MLACAGAGLALGFTASAYAVELSATLTDTQAPLDEPPPEPTPDAAPTPALPPKPKAVVKARPAPVQHAAVPRYTPPVRPTTYRKSRATPQAARPARPKAAKHRAKRRVTHAVAAPKPAPQRATKPHLARIHIGPQTAALTPSTDDERNLVIAGLAVALLFFLLVVAVPSTGARFTAPGRVVMGHQIDLVLAGVAALLVTGIAFATGAG